MLPTEFKGYDLEADGLLMVGTRDDEDIIVLIEFQSVNDKSMGERLLEYSFRAKTKYGKPVIACVIFLRPDGIVPEPPLIWELRNGKKILVFDYTCIKLWLMAAEELLAFDQPALLPLTMLTKGGANRIIVDKMFDGLVANGLHDLLPVGNLLASLVLGTEDLEWLERRYKQMTDILKDTPAYHWMTEDARKEGILEGREQERRAAQETILEQLRVAQEAVLEKLRGKVVMLVTARFPKLARFAKKQVSDVEDMERLLDLISNLKIASKPDDVRQYLIALDEGDQIAQ